MKAVAPSLVICLEFAPLTRSIAHSCIPKTRLDYFQDFCVCSMHPTQLFIVSDTWRTVNILEPHRRNSNRSWLKMNHHMGTPIVDKKPHIHNFGLATSHCLHKMH